MYIQLVDFGEREREQLCEVENASLLYRQIRRHILVLTSHVFMHGSEMWKKEMAAIWKSYLPPENGEEIAHDSAGNQNSGEASQSVERRRSMESQLAMQDMQEADARFSR